MQTGPLLDGILRGCNCDVKYKGTICSGIFAELWKSLFRDGRELPYGRNLPEGAHQDIVGACDISLFGRLWLAEPL
jgi:hypothetical protein